MNRLLKSVLAGMVLVMGFSLTAASKDWGKATVVSDSGKHVFSVALALSPAEQQRGLGGVQSLEDGEGMLFVYKTAEKRSFWMKGMLIPIDIIYIGPDGRIANIIHSIQPTDMDPRESEGPAIAVLEIAAGRSKTLGFKPGDKVEHPAFRFAMKRVNPK